jgi:hypothetical protein
MQILIPALFFLWLGFLWSKIDMRKRAKLDNFIWEDFERKQQFGQLYNNFDSF